MVLDLHPLAAVHIAERMRASDRAEVLAVSPIRDLETWARRVVACAGVAKAAIASDGEAVAMGGGMLVGHLAAVWFVATPRIEEPAVRVTCHRMALIAHRELAAHGVRRCQAVAAADNLAIAPWLERMGYRREGVHPAYGRDGETFTTWAKLLRGPHGN